MAIDYFIGWSQADLETELEAAQEDLLAGSSTIHAGAGSVTLGSKVNDTPQARIRLILLALNKRDPVTYPMSNIVPMTQARVVFGCPNPPSPWTQ